MPIKNASDTTVTIIDYYNALKRDVWNTSKLGLYENYDGVLINNLDILSDYYSYFKNFLVTIELEEKYYYMPNLFAKEYYGTDALDFIVLYFSNISSPMYFNKPKISILPIERITELNKLIIHSESKTRENQANPPKYVELDQNISLLNNLKNIKLKR